MENLHSTISFVLNIFELVISKVKGFCFAKATLFVWRIRDVNIASSSFGFFRVKVTLIFVTRLNDITQNSI